MQETETAKTEQKHHQIEAHLAQRGQIYADILKIGVNTAAVYLRLVAADDE